MNLLATQIFNETPFVSRAMVPEKIPQRLAYKTENKPQRIVKERENSKKPEKLKTTKMKSDIGDPFFFEDFLQDFSCDSGDSEISCGGGSYLGMLSELLTSSSDEEREKPKKKASRPKTAQSYIKKTENMMLKHEINNKENIFKASNMLNNNNAHNKNNNNANNYNNNVRKTPEVRKKVVSSVRRGRHSPEHSEKSTQTGKAARMQEIKDQHLIKNSNITHETMFPKNNKYRKRAFSEKAIQTTTRSPIKHHFSEAKPKIRRNSHTFKENHHKQHKNQPNYHKTVPNYKPRPFSASPPKFFYENDDYMDKEARNFKGISTDNNVKPKFNLHFKKSQRQEDDRYYRFSPSHRKKMLEQELERKKQQAILIKNQRKKREDFYKQTQDQARKFIFETKKRLIERKKKEKVDWESKLYSYSVIKQQKTHELEKKKTKVIEYKAMKLDKKRSRNEEKRYQEIEKINDYVKAKVFKSIENKPKPRQISRDDSKHAHKKRYKLEKPLTKPLRFGKPPDSPVRLLAKSLEKPKRIHKGDFNLKDAMAVFEDRASNYLSVMALERKKKEKMKKMKKLKIREMQKKAREIVEKCRKRKFVPKKDFNQSQSDDEEFEMLKNKRDSKEQLEEDEDNREQPEYKHVTFPDKKKEKKTKITGKPHKLQKELKNLRKQDLKLYKFPSKGEKFNEIDEDEQKRLLQSQKKDKNAKFPKVPSSDINKVLDEAKIRKLPKEVLNSAKIDTINNENIIEKNLKDYRDEREKKKKKMEGKKEKQNEEENEEKLQKLMGLENPIERFQKEFGGDFDDDDFPEELLG